METHAPRLRQLAPVAALALVAVLLVAFGWRAFGGSLPLQAAGYRVDVPIGDALNMEVGADVTISGVHVGDVVAVRLTHLRPVATVELKPRYAPLHAGARAIPRTKSLLGEAYIELTPGGPHRAPIPEHDTLPAADVRPAQTLDQVLETFSPRARRDFRRFTRGLAAALHGRGADLSAAIGEAGPAAADAANIAEVLARQREDLSRLIANSGEVFGAVGERDGALRLAVRSSRSVLATTARSRRALAATVRALPGFLESLTRTADGLDGAARDLGGAASALRPPAARLEPALRRLRAAAPVVSTTFRRLSPALSAGTRGLPAATGLVRAAGPALAASHGPLREAIPVVQLLAQVRESVVAFFANFGSLVNGRVYAPGGGTGTTGAAVPSFWNETIGGWLKKLPSSRGNPYPKPGAAREIAEGGLLSFDCRHLGNRQYIPPTGGHGAPPCRTQGAWTFNGRTAYYPRLQPTPP
jgi:virulence factor Mce-like protein